MFIVLPLHPDPENTSLGTCCMCLDGSSIHLTFECALDLLEWPKCAHLGPSFPNLNPFATSPMPTWSSWLGRNQQVGGQEFSPHSTLFLAGVVCPSLLISPIMARNCWMRGHFPPWSLSGAVCIPFPIWQMKQALSPHSFVIPAGAVCLPHPSWSGCTH